MYSCHSILECYNLLSEVKLSIRSFCFISTGSFWSGESENLQLPKFGLNGDCMM